MHYVAAKSIVSARNGMNLYRGCQHGCIYCDARSRCYQMNHVFEDIEVNPGSVKPIPDFMPQKKRARSFRILLDVIE